MKRKLSCSLVMFSFCLQCVSTAVQAEDDSAPHPDADYGRIKLHEPLPKHAEIFANWLHDRGHNYRILIPPMSTIHCPRQPIDDSGFPILLRIVPYEMQVVDVGLIPSCIDGESLTAEELLDQIPADERTDIIRKTSAVGTPWIGRGFRSVGDDAPPPTMTMLTKKSDEHFLVVRFQSGTQMEMRTALSIVDSISFVEAEFRLEDILTMREMQEPQNEFVPARTVRAWFENDRAHGLVTQEDARGRRVFTLTWLNWRQSGLEIQHWPGGGVYCLRLFENDVAQVQRVTFYESGEVHTMMDIQDGVAEGAHGVYYSNGQLATITENSKGKPHGERLHYLPDGRLIGRTIFNHGKEVGNEVLLRINQREYDSTLQGNPEPHAVWNVK